MFAFLFGFATIRAEVIPAGVMPKRQVAGTGVTSSTSSTSSTTSDTPTPSSTTPDTTTPSTSAGNTPSSNSPIPDSSTAPPTSKGVTSPAPSSQQVLSSSVVPTTIAVTTTNKDGSTVTTKISTSTLAPVSKTKATSAITSTNNKGESIVKVGTKTINPSTLSHKTTIRAPLVAKETRHSTFTSFWTSDGQVYSSVFTTADVFASTTGYATATIAPGLANGGGSGSNLSSNAKSIIGGVVGGIGGAILIGGLAFVGWRLWGKKKAAQGSEDYYDGSQADSIAGNKRESMGVLSNSGMSEGGSGNGLERYQNPNGRINTASNF